MGLFGTILYNIVAIGLVFTVANKPYIIYGYTWAYVIISLVVAMYGYDMGITWEYIYIYVCMVEYG